MENKLLSRLLAEQQAIEKGLCQFPVSDFASYQKQVGRWMGIQASIDILMEIIKDADED